MLEDVHKNCRNPLAPFTAAYEQPCAFVNKRLISRKTSKFKCVALLWSLKNFVKMATTSFKKLIKTHMRKFVFKVHCIIANTALSKTPIYLFAVWAGFYLPTWTLIQFKRNEWKTILHCRCSNYKESVLERKETIIVQSDKILAVKLETGWIFTDLREVEDREGVFPTLCCIAFAEPVYKVNTLKMSLKSRALKTIL